MYPFPEEVIKHFIPREPRGINIPMKLNATRIEQALRLVAGQMELASSPAARLVVCGGASLIATGVLSRVTKDVDVVALRSGSGELMAPVPMPEGVMKAAAVVARDMGLDANSLNNGPSRDEGGLFQMGLPAGFAGAGRASSPGVRPRSRQVGGANQATPGASPTRLAHRPYDNVRPTTRRSHLLLG